MREAFRPFTKIVTVSDQNELTVDLHDSAGNSISCNHVSVESVSGAGGVDDLFFVSPVGVGVGASVAASGLTSISASGVVGAAAAIGTGNVTLSLLGSDACSSIKISQSVSTPVAYAVTYGVVTLSNPVRDAAFNSGS